MLSENRSQSRIDEILIMIKAAWPSFTENQGIVYAKLLSDIPDIVLYKAVVAVCKESRYMPTIAEIRNKAEAIYKQAKGIERPDASKAWGTVIQEISHTGRYGKPKFQDELTEETVKRMGWVSLCEADSNSTSIQRAQFMKIYTSLAERRTEEREIGYLLADGEIQKLVNNVSSNMLEKGKNHGI